MLCDKVKTTFKKLNVPLTLINKYIYLLLPVFITLYGCSDEVKSDPASSSTTQVVVNKKNVNLTQQSIQTLLGAMDLFNKNILEVMSKETSAFKKGVPAEICQTLMTSLLSIDTLAKHLDGQASNIEFQVETKEKIEVSNAQSEITEISTVIFGLPEGKCFFSSSTAVSQRLL